MSSSAPTTADPDDLDPIVILDDEQAGLSAAGLSQAIDAETAAALCMGVDDATLARLLTPAQRRRLGDDGAWLRTCDPRRPDEVVGLVRLTPAQRKHTFTTNPPAGIACRPDLLEAEHIVLCDSPWHTLALYQAGVRAVALVEDPVVLPPLADAFLGKRITIASPKAAGIAAMRSGLGLAGGAATAVMLSSIPGRISAKVRAALGLAPAQAPEQPDQTACVSPRLLRDLHRYAEGRLQTAEGMAALRALGLDDADIMRAYRPGYLPVEFRDVLPAADRAALRGIKGNCVVLPAFDAHGVVVDLFIAKPGS